MLGYDDWNAPSSGATRVSEVLSGAESRKTPSTVDNWFENQVVDGFAKFGTPLGMLQTFRPDIGKPQIARRPFEQSHAELILQLRAEHGATRGGERHIEASRRFRETLRLSDFGENCQ